MSITGYINAWVTNKTGARLFFQLRRFKDFRHKAETCPTSDSDQTEPMLLSGYRPVTEQLPYNLCYHR